MQNTESKENPANVMAVDVVILPPSDVTEQAINLNSQIKNSPFPLAKTDYLPHITLFATFVNNLPEAVNAIKQVSFETQPFKVVMGEVFSRDMDPAWGGGKIQNSWNVGSSGELLRLHQKLVEGLPHVDLLPDGSRAFVGSEVSKATMEYVHDFRSKNSDLNYWPHITLGNGDNGLDQRLVKEFVCDEIALVQFGDFCTARKVLGRFKLGAK